MSPILDSDSPLEAEIMISSLVFFTGLLPFRECASPEAILDSGVTSMSINSSIDGSPLNVSGSERLER
jgi:hypothetical protein